MIAIAKPTKVCAATKEDRDHEDVEPVAGPDFSPTEAPPGSCEKIEVLRRRIERGQPLWHTDDRHDFALLSGVVAVNPRSDERHRATPNYVAEGARGRFEEVVKFKMSGGDALETEERALRDAQNEARQYVARTLGRGVAHIESAASNVQPSSSPLSDLSVPRGRSEAAAMPEAGRAESPAEGEVSGMRTGGVQPLVRALTPAELRYLSALSNKVRDGSLQESVLRFELQELARKGVNVTENLPPSVTKIV